MERSGPPPHLPHLPAASSQFATNWGVQDISVNDRCLILNVRDNVDKLERKLASSDLDWPWG